MIHLTPRQQMAARLVRPGRPLADIGTDHAQLPVALLQQGVIPFAYCLDVREGPLQNARATIARCGLEDKTEVILSDGFAGLTPGCCHDFVLAGMGGVLVTGLRDAVSWVREPGNHFVLQPQSHLDTLRRYLFDNGFEILKEDAVEDHGRPYTAMEIFFTGEEIPHSEADCFIGKMNQIEDRELQVRYFTSLSHYLEDRIHGGETGLDDVLSRVKECLKACQP